MFATTDVDGPVGADAELVFARPSASARRCSSPHLPTRWSNFQLSAAKKNGFSDPTPVGGEVERPSRDHAYTYVVKTRGFPIRFRLSDTPASDNYGQLRITGRHGEPEDCTTYGYRTFNYANRKACERGLSAG
jgi:hypothetical protein